MESDSEMIDQSQISWLVIKNVDKIQRLDGSCQNRWIIGKTLAFFPLSQTSQWQTSNQQRCHFDSRNCPATFELNLLFCWPERRRNRLWGIIKALNEDSTLLIHSIVFVIILWLLGDDWILTSAPPPPPTAKIPAINNYRRLAKGSTDLQSPSLVLDVGGRRDGAGDNFSIYFESRALILRLPSARWRTKKEEIWKIPSFDVQKSWSRPGLVDVCGQIQKNLKSRNPIKSSGRRGASRRMHLAPSHSAL